MRFTHARLFTLITLSALVLLTLPAHAQNNSVRLDINRGVTNEIWKIEDEPTLVINGFDLTPTPLRLPIAIESVTIDITAPVPGNIATAVVYADANGGSPDDAELVGAGQFSIREAGVYVAQFERPIIVDAPVAWVGFYLPVGIEFRADTQGSSVLTYWAWAPGNTFNLAQLSSAPVLGPSDGSDPVNLDIGGVARITAFARSANDLIPQEELNSQRDVVENPEQATSFLTNYNGCVGLFVDTGDIDVSWRSTIDSTCREVEAWRSPDPPAGYDRFGRDGFFVYDITFFDDSGEVVDGNIPIAVTHCFAADLNKLDDAVIGVAYGAPRRWDLLQTEVIGNLLCAEVNRGGNLAYFTPN